MANVELRRRIVDIITNAGEGHIPSSFSVIDIIARLYEKHLKVDPQNPDWEDRDRFVLSAGHKATALYAALAEAGFFSEDILDSYGSLDSRLPGHPSMRKLPGLEASTGALGHGLSIAGGMALGLKMDGKPSRVFVLMGDGELAEGS